MSTLIDEEFLDNLLESALNSCSNDVNLNDSICAVCETGGDMICCDGRCLRSFHPKCIGLRDSDIPDDRPFICSDCWNRVHRCFSCKVFEVEEKLVKCSLTSCGKFYHSKVFLEIIFYFCNSLTVHKFLFSELVNCSVWVVKRINCLFVLIILAMSARKIILPAQIIKISGSASVVQKRSMRNIVQKMCIY